MRLPWSSWLRVSPWWGQISAEIGHDVTAPIQPRLPHNSSAVLRVCWSEICDGRGNARFSCCSTLLRSWRPATKSCRLQAASSPSLQKKVSFIYVFFFFFFFSRLYPAGPASSCTLGLFLHLSDQCACITSVPVLFHPAGHFQSDSDLSIVHPVKTTAEGGFISHSLSHHFEGGRFRRDLQPAGLEEQVYYRVNYKGRSLTFNLTVNHHLVSSDYVLERRNGGANRTEQPFSEGNSCHLVGTVEASDVGRGTAAVSACGGLVRGFVHHNKAACMVKEWESYFWECITSDSRNLF